MDQKLDQNLIDTPEKDKPIKQYDLLVEAKSDLMFNVGTYGFYFPAVALLFIAQYVMSDCNNTKLVSESNNSTYSAYQQINETQASINLDKNMASVSLKIAALVIITFSMLIMVSILVVPLRVTNVNKIIIFIPFLVFTVACGLQVFMLYESFNLIVNNDVGPGYSSTMQWITLTNVIFAMVLFYNTLLVNMLAVQLFVGSVLLMFNYSLHKWLYVFVTDG